ncbi:hypothetical protein AB4Y96_13120 [Phyllobacterium sp. TAF24]|uniref:hypothetical protein n=1 Tax=Phyllobacterium sp. TAF24 TaxID=3233068 RepID=UPI003F975AB2
METPPSPREIYLKGLQDLAKEHGNDYAMQAAATTMANLLAMVSMAMYRLSAPPLFLPPETPPTKRKKN